MNNAVIRKNIRVKEELADISALGCLLYTWGLTACDSYGRIKASAGHWALTVVPGKANVDAVKAELETLFDAGVLVKYETNGIEYAFYPDWFDTQSFNELYTMIAECPNPDTGEVEPKLQWRVARERYNLRRRKPKSYRKGDAEGSSEITVRNEGKHVSDEGGAVITVSTDEVTVKEGATNTTLSSSSNHDIRESVAHLDDMLVTAMASAIAGVKKYDGASRPPTPDRLVSLAKSIREVAPDDETAIRDLVQNWFDFHSADEKGRYGKHDPVASMRQQISYYTPRWVVMKKRTTRNTARQSPSGSVSDELRNLMGVGSDE